MSDVRERGPTRAKRAKLDTKMSNNNQKSASTSSNLKSDRNVSELHTVKPRKAQKCSPALLNDLILERVFSYLSYEEIKTCRLVCHRWSHAGEPRLRKLSTVSFSSSKNTFGKFDKTFENSQTIMPFGSVILSSNDGKAASAGWPVSRLERFFTDWQDKIRSLEMYYIDVFKMINKSFGKRKSNLQKFILCPTLQNHLTSLTINCLNSTKIIISVDHLKSVKILNLAFDVVLHMGTNGRKLTPAEIELKSVIYVNDGTILNSVLINDFVDFSKTKKIHISEEIPAKTKLSIDMTGNITVDDLHLDAVEILGERNAKWIVNQMFSLTGIPWNQPNQMQFANMNFNDSTLDIATLPQTIECLRIQFTNRNTIDVVSSFPVSLNNLQYLSLRSDAEDDDFLPLFKNCPKLTDVAYQCLWNDGLKTEWLAPSIRRLEITEIAIDLDQGDPFELETLILYEWHTEDWRMAVDTFSFQNLVICTRHYETRFSNLANIWYLDKLKEMIKNIRMLNDTAIIYVGPVVLTKESRFLECVNRAVIDVEDATTSNPLQYWFRFEGEFGDAIEESQFDKIRVLVNSDRFAKSEEDEFY